MTGLYAKAIAGAALLALTTWITGLASGGMTDQETVAVVSAFVVGGGGIFLIPMSPAWVNTYGKAVWTAIAAFLASLWAAVPDGVSQVEWLTMAVAVIVSTGVVAVVPNARRSEVITQSPAPV